MKKTWKRYEIANVIPHAAFIYMRWNSNNIRLIFHSSEWQWFSMLTITFIILLHGIMPQQLIWMHIRIHSCIQLKYSGAFHFILMGNIVEILLFLRCKLIRQKQAFSQFYSFWMPVAERLRIQSSTHGNPLKLHTSEIEMNFSTKSYILQKINHNTMSLDI